MTRITLGINCNCFTNRYDEPDEWTRICADLGIRAVMFNIDLIDPYWPWDLQKRLCDETLDACARRGIEIRASFGGHHGHQHYLGHPDPECRAEAERFFRAAVRQAAYLGAESFGTCFAIMTVTTQSNPELRERVIVSALEAYQRLASYAADAGLEALSYEATSIPRESCATFAENDRVLAASREWKVPMRVCLDLGHRYLGGSAAESDPIEWIRRYGEDCRVIDCQQTDGGASRHWPFTSGNNANGIVDAEAVVEAIEESGATDVLIAFEIRTSAFHPQEESFLSDLTESVEYWRGRVDL